jgi:Protein of unknown function (DUF1573)
MLARIVVIGLIMVSFSSSAVASALSFAELDHHATVKLGATRAEWVYHFINTGERAINITAVESHCGCTTVSPDNTMFTSGASGSIAVIMAIGKTAGTFVQTVDVHTDEPNDYKLRLFVTIGLPISIRPRVLIWDEGSLAPKTVHVTIDPDLKLSLVGLKASNESAFMVTTKADAASGAFTVIVTPRPGMKGASVRFDPIFDHSPLLPYDTYIYAVIH